MLLKKLTTTFSNFQIDWTLRAKIELHVTQELKEQVDNLDVCFIVSDTPLEFARKRLVTALEHYDGSSPFVCIDNAISEVEKCATSAPGAMRQRSYPWLNGGYFHLLANAVICFMIEVRPARALARPDALKLPRCLQMSQASKKKLEHRLIRMISEPLNSYGSVPSLRPNLQTQRTFPPRNYFSLQKTPSIDSADGQSYCSEMSAADSDQCSGSATDLSLHMVKHWIEARTGDLVVINCDILCEDSTLKVKWYLGEKQVTSVGRFRITSSVGRHSLEIFDCEAFDSGEVICLAVASSGVCSDVAILNVHEEDIAGEEPSFIEPLTYEQTSNNELILRCVVAGFPMPYVVFHQKNQRIHLDSRTSLKRDNSAWTLTLRDCCKMDEGRYSVIARNRIGRALSHINVESSEDSGRNPSYSFVADV
ncbi:hypothetical protein AB6A40_002444 [Gnathostoma spinigerum]|uniref:Ig-like domain-containing protein n=1 Tax=Gnathostoma spinigerum TaxID=75299 RepID=A0ABD6EHD7_9BILA